MRCLLVEDEPNRVAVMLPELTRFFGQGNVEVVGDRDSAIDSINNRAFDLIVLDQRIPTKSGQLDPDIIHGRAVFDHVQTAAPDTPVYFLTGLPIEDEYVDYLMEKGAKSDVWGDRKPVPLVRKFQKSTMAPFYEAAASIAATARVTDDIEINTKGIDLALSANEARLMRCFARLQGGVCLDVEVLSDELSGARVLKTDVKADGGEVRMSAASKLGQHESITNEIEHYEREVMRLPAGTYAPRLPGPTVQVVGVKGAFYRLLDGYDRSLFDVLGASDAEAAACVRTIRGHQAPWANDPAVRKMRVGDIAKLLIWEDRLPAIHALLGGVDWQRYEDREISINICTRHGDLHGENVRVDAELRTMLIDYGSVNPLPSAIDAITLELSPFFHPHGFRRFLNWTPNSGDIDWFDRDAFSALTVTPAYIHATRDWAHADAFGNREALACAYTYVLRQLQFPKADRELAKALIAGIVKRALRE